MLPLFRLGQIDHRRGHHIGRRVATVTEWVVDSGWIESALFLALAAVLGGAFLWLAWQLRRDPTRRRAGILFHYSLAYLALLFVAAAIDPVLM